MKVVSFGWVTAFVWVVGCSSSCSPPPAMMDASGHDAVSDLGGGQMDATVSMDAGDAGLCMNPPDGATQADGAPLPNLVVIPERLSRRAQVVYQYFSDRSCDYTEERCVGGPGCRRLLRFDLVVANVGAGDFYLGPPTAANRRPPMFEWSMCHNHYHLQGFAEFRLLDARGEVVRMGNKESFCLMDLERLPGGPDIARQYRFNCSNQGIHAGWSDIYDRGLDCQYVDVTDVPPGRYRLQARINTQCHILESNYEDNTAEVEIDIPPAADGGCAPIDPLQTCTNMEQGLDRDCGWRLVGTQRCMPGTRVVVGCDPYCAPPLGSCGGDPMIRVCPGVMPCTRADAIASNDDNTACTVDGGSNVCARVSFTCPESGQYTVLVGPYESGQTFRCDIAVAGP